MQFHRGRLIDHVHLFASNLEASKNFYTAILKTLGRDLTTESEHFFVCDELFVSDKEMFGQEEGDDNTRIHLAFQAADPEQVKRFHAEGLKAGGKDNGAPGERYYHPGYFSAYLLDPDGNNIEAVFHGPSKRSAEAIVITPGSI